MFQFIADPNWNNTDAIIDGMVAHLEDPEPERQRLKEHAWSVVCPGFEYFRTKFTVDLHHQVQLLIRMREIRPSIKDLDELNMLKCIGIPKPLIDLTALQLKTELPVYLALAQDINDQDLDENCILPFFKTHRKELPNWGNLRAYLQPSK